MESNPWELHPDLTEDRLITIGKIITKTRKEALQLYEPESGDGPWSLECRIYERTMNGFIAAAKELSWLRCVRKNLYFLVLVGKVPIRFKRRDFERAAEMDIKLFGPEIMAHQLAFDFDQSGWYWRVFIETDEFRDILRLVLAQITEQGNTRNAYTIPVSGSVSIAAPVIPAQRQAAAVEKVKLGVKTTTVKRVADNGSK
jgi:hypothetical protein